MQTIRKSDDGNLIIVLRSTGYAVSRRTPRWTTQVAYRGTEVMEWETIGKGLTLDRAEALFYLNLNRKAA